MIKLLNTLAILVVLIGRHAIFAGNQYDTDAQIRSYSSNANQDGSYSFQFDTTNGIARQENGVGGYYAQGSSGHYAPDGQLIQLQYIADENGFRATGDHLPTSPPIPEAIVRSLEYIRTHPQEDNLKR